MKNLSCVFLVCLLTSAYTQTGVKFAPDRSVWRQNFSYVISGYPGNFVFGYGYPNNYIKGDTVVSGKYCQKMYSNNKTVFDTVCLGSKSLLYYNNRKLYVDTTLVYDFNLVLGDTIQIYFGATVNHPAGKYTYTVSACDSVNIGSKWRKRITMYRAFFNGLVIKWVDGIGDITYGFNSNYTQIETLTYGYGSYALTCFSENFQNTYGSGCGVSSICANVSSTSTLACNAYSSTVNFAINSGTAPYSFTVQAPACGSSFTASSTNANPSFSLSCAGVYTFTVKDASNSSLGFVTHTVIANTFTTVSVNTIKDTVCAGEALSLGVAPTGSTYTLNPINWSTGAFGSSITVTPSVTTTYSLSALYTTVNSRTCTASGNKTIIVNACAGIQEIDPAQGVKIFPNPCSVKLIVQNQTGTGLMKCFLFTIDGMELPLKQTKKEEFDVSDLPEGLYFLRLEMKEGTSTKKVIVKR